MKNHDSRFPMSSKFLTAIGVYGLADKYEIITLRACALDQLPSPAFDRDMYYKAAIKSDDVANIVKAHYGQCVQGNCAMGRKICLSIIRHAPAIAKCSALAGWAHEHPALAIDMYFAGRENGGKIW
jgi:hypothetical protein